MPASGLCKGKTEPLSTRHLPAICCEKALSNHLLCSEAYAEMGGGNVNHCPPSHQRVQWTSPLSASCHLILPQRNNSRVISGPFTDQESEAYIFAKHLHIQVSEEAEF